MEAKQQDNSSPQQTRQQQQSLQLQLPAPTRQRTRSAMENNELGEAQRCLHFNDNDENSVDNSQQKKKRPTEIPEQRSVFVT